MTKKNFRFVPAAAAAAIVAVAALTNGCSAADALCCKAYNPGSDMSQVNFTGDVAVNAQMRALAQAAGDLASVAGQAQIDVTNACKGIAVDLGESSILSEADAAKSQTELMNYWCGKAQAKLQPFMGQVSIAFTPINCSASVSAQATCKGQCDVNAKCDIKANPPKCTGGKLEISCKGGCTAEGTAPSVACSGSCSAMCQGTCEATAMAPKVECQGKCEGTCEAGGMAGGTGIQGDGSCKGTCSGKCTYEPGKAPMVQCQGSCQGQCTGSCTATPGSVSVKCDGKCDADYEPLQCTGGKLEGGCMVDAKCEASCNASASAKAECTPPTFTVTITGAGPDLPKVKATLEANLPAIAVVYKARGQAFLDTIGSIAQIGGQITASGKLDVAGTACIGFIGDNIVTTTTSFTATLSAAGSIGKMTGM